jgi:hypothetical protein
MRRVLEPCRTAGVKIVTNAGAANPLAAAELVRRSPARSASRGYVAAVTGDDVLGQLEGASAFRRRAAPWPTSEIA